MPSPSGDRIQWPNTRIGYAGINNPGFWADWTVADQGIQTAIMALMGINLTTDFALLGGFAYTAGSTGTYGPGWFYLNGNIYYQSTAFNEGLRLVQNVTAGNSQLFPTDGVSRNTYNVNFSQTGTGATQTPVFTVGGNMTSYRLDNKTLSQYIALPGSWITVGGSGSPAFGSGYTVGSSQSVQFRKNSTGFTEIYGTFQQVSGTSNNLVFTLPTGYRPPYIYTGAIYHNGGVDSTADRLGSVVSTALQLANFTIGTDGTVNAPVLVGGGANYILQFNASFNAY